MPGARRCPQCSVYWPPKDGSIDAFRECPRCGTKTLYNSLAEPEMYDEVAISELRQHQFDQWLVANGRA